MNIVDKGYKRYRNMNIEKEAEDFIKERKINVKVEEIKLLVKNIKKELDKLEKLIYINN